jgi:DNA-directed RNA polymerase specialized sigma24 family protein
MKKVSPPSSLESSGTRKPNSSAKPSEASGADQRLELREVIKENDQALYDFCNYLLLGHIGLDEVLLSIFREFGRQYRRYSSRGDASWQHMEMKLRLFHLAWEQVQMAARSQRAWFWMGRDTRPLKLLDENLLAASEKGKGTNAQLTGGQIEVILERLSRLELSYRAPLVLKDILQFDDEEVVRILGLRWGVYRHRLHRGRMDLLELLRGTAPSPGDGFGRSPVFSPGT